MFHLQDGLRHYAWAGNKGSRLICLKLGSMAVLEVKMIGVDLKLEGQPLRPRLVSEWRSSTPQTVVYVWDFRVAGQFSVVGTPLQRGLDMNIVEE